MMDLSKEKTISDDKFARLPEFARPFLYEISLSPCLETFKFEGKETIHLEIIKSTNFLQLHSSGLQIENASLKLANGKVFDLKIQIDAKWSLLSLQICEQIEPQKVELEIQFNGEIRNELEGFYRSPYRDVNGKEQFLASTQFESTYARKAFPCWDEPIYKAEFDIHMEIAEHLCALSNMDVIEERKGTKEGRKLVKFGRSPPMSTYLVAFAIGQFEFVQDKTKDGCRIRVYTVPGKKDKANYALKVAVTAFEWFTEWYGVEMPLNKCDLIGIPEFAMGAMENWGLITFREAVLLYDPSLTSSAIKQRITTTVTHEIGHFWFGNLVTMKWWNDLWLKEGFASFMEYVFTGYNFPEFKIWLDFVNGETRIAMRLDALRNSHPIQVPIDNPNELDEIYDNITYAKSNSIIRMLFNYLGESTIQKGLRIYLNRHKYSNTETEDLWQCLSEASGINVNALMGSWTGQMGFPLVEVSERQLDGNRRELEISQRRFLADGGLDEGNTLWQVPIPITVSTDPTKPKEKFLLKNAKEIFVLEEIKSDEWIKLNSGFTSFFRAHYSDQMFRQLLVGMERGEMDVLDRFQICNDLFAIVQSGQSKMSKFLELFAACSHREDNLVVWQSMSAGLTEIDQMLGHFDGVGSIQLKAKFHEFICKLVEPVAAIYGWEPEEGEDIQTGQLRALLLSLLARSHHQPTIQIGLAKFNDHIQKGIQLVPDLRSVIFGIAARTNESKMVEELHKIMAECNFSEIERACILALGQCSDPGLLEQIYKNGIEGKAIKSQDIFYLFTAANHSANYSIQMQNWEYFKKNVQYLINLWGSPTTSMFQNCLEYANNRFCTEKAANDLQEFCNSNFDEQVLKTLDRPIQQILETIKLNGQMMKNNIDNLKKFFQAY